MLSNSSQVAKLYLSIIDDVIENTRELFMDEGLEDQVLDDLRHLWESKLMQSKVMDDFKKSNINSSNFVLQLPANYQPTEPELSASVTIPASQNNGLPAKNNSESLATFSLPAALAYPIQIPAGVTLQTASGQLYKVNIPVVVTQAPASRPTQREAPAPHPTPDPPNPVLHQETEPTSFVAQTHASLPVIPERDLPHPTFESEITLGEDEASPAPEPVNASPLTQLLNFQISAEQALKQTAQSRDIDEILKEVIEEESEKARKLSAGNTDNEPNADLGLDLDYAYSQLSEIVQLDGPPDNSEEEEEIPQDENDFLGLINAEAIKALQEENISSGSNSISSSDEDPVELSNVEEEDPLNSGDDVVEQDIPDLFDTENVIVCQYDKIHRSKNRWKFHLKDGVMSYGGKDHVFSKAVGEAEW